MSDRRKNQPAAITGAGPGNFRETADIETASAAYAQRFAGPVGAWMLERQTLIVREMTGPPCGNRRLLDVGGGHGQVAGSLSESGWLVTVQGSDAVCAARLPEPLRRGFVASDPLSLPFGDAFFEAVVCMRWLTHCRQWEALVSELCRVARGIVVVDYPVSGGLNRWAPLLFNFKKRLEGNTRTWRPFRKNELQKVFASRGFRSALCRAQYFWPMVLHRKLGSVAASRLLETAARYAGLTSRYGSPVIMKAERMTCNRCGQQEHNASG